VLAVAQQVHDGSRCLMLCAGERGARGEVHDTGERCKRRERGERGGKEVNKAGEVKEAGER